MNKIINILIVLLLLGSCILNVVLVSDLNKKTTELIELTDIEPEIIFLDSLVCDSMYLTKTEVVRLPIVDTILTTDTIQQTDTIIAVDSVFVEVPIHTYHYDTTLSETHINLICEGFDVKLNSLLVERINITQKQEKAVKTNRFGLGVGLGITYYDGFKILPTIGINYNLLSF